MKNMNNEEKNSYVRKQITGTLLKLLETQKLSDISVSVLCNEAGVGRASFYRNYETKNDIITAYIVNQWRSYEASNKLKEHKIDDIYRVKRYFEFCYSLKDLNTLLIDQDQTNIILRAYETVVPDLDQGGNAESFSQAFLAYGLFGMFLKWAKNGYMQSLDEMAEIVATQIFKDYQTERF